MPRQGTPDHIRGYIDHRTGDPRPRQPNSAAWSESPVPVSLPHRGSATTRPYSQATSWHDSPSTTVTLPVFAMQTAFPPSDYYTGSVPSDASSRRRACPPPSWPDGRRATPDGSHVHSLTGRQVRCPAMPLRHRRIYAAGLRCGLPADDMQPTRGVPHPYGRVRAAIQPRSARFELVG